MAMTTHYWIRGERGADRVAARSGLDLPPLLATVSAHRRRRGPYTAAGALVRSIADDALRRRPELGPRHHIELLTSAPELTGRVPAIKVPLEMTTAAGSRTRYQARLHTLRVAHGLVDFLHAYLHALGGERRTLVIEDIHEADPSDREFVAVLLRRTPPELLTVVVGGDRAPVTDPPGPMTVSLPAMLAAHTAPVDAPPAPRRPGAPGTAAAYVERDGTSDDPALLAAYRDCPAARRAALHDARATVLSGLGEESLSFGAIVYHHEHGTDPAGAGATMLRAAQLHFKSLGLYHAAVDYGLRGRGLVDREAPDQLWWRFTGDITTSLSALGRAEEAEGIYAELRALTDDPEVHMHTAYATAMLYARHYGDDRRDPHLARQWLHVAVAISSLLPDPKDRAFYTVFNRNGIALVETRVGRADAALELLNSGMCRLDEVLAPGEQLLHRTGLRYNRAQVYIMTGRLDEALADLDTVIEVDPHFHDHYFNRGNVLRRLGRTAEAVEDYGRALALSPPYPEAYYNRADALLELGDLPGALADLSRVIELDPDNADARLNRASIRQDLGDDDGALEDVAAGLALRPADARLLCLDGQLRAARGAAEEAWTSLSAAVAADPALAQAWAIRGMCAYEAGDLDAALADLDRAAQLLDSPQIRYNRAVARQEAGRFADAAEDYRAVLDMVDDEDARTQLYACRLAAAAAGRG
jgi:tetratricopeptide (TPR) repeat protein